MLSDQIVVRRFVPEDAEQVAVLIRTTLLTSNVPDYDDDELESLAAWYSPQGLRSREGIARRFVAVDAAHPHRIVGTAARRENRIEAFFVLPEWQRQGVGATLLDVIEDDARAQAMRAIWLESSLTAVDFYTGHGFETVSEARDLGDGLVVEMRKPI